MKFRLRLLLRKTNVRAVLVLDDTVLGVVKIGWSQPRRRSYYNFSPKRVNAKNTAQDTWTRSFSLHLC